MDVGDFVGTAGPVARRRIVDLLKWPDGTDFRCRGGAGGVLGGDYGERDDVGDGDLLASTAGFGANDIVHRVDAAAAAGARTGAHTDIGRVAGALADRLANRAVGDAVAVANKHGFVEAPSGCANDLGNLVRSR